MYFPYRDVGVIISEYNNIVRPLIVAGHYGLAYFKMCTVNSLICGRGFENVISKVHGGLIFSGAAKLLEEKLSEGNHEEIERAKLIFEAFMSQSKVPGGD
jgi:hypothetical protein